MRPKKRIWLDENGTCLTCGYTKPNKLGRCKVCKSVLDLFSKVIRHLEVESGLRPAPKARIRKARLHDPVKRKSDRIKSLFKEKLNLAKWKKENSDKNAAYQRRRVAAKLNATPSWANEFFISEAYHIAKVRSKATGIKWHVDHIVPLRSKLVCGLHVEHNLQVIPAKLNESKGNRVWPDGTF